MTSSDDVIDDVIEPRIKLPTRCKKVWSNPPTHSREINFLSFRYEKNENTRILLIKKKKKRRFIQPRGDHVCPSLTPPTWSPLTSGVTSGQKKIFFQKGKIFSKIFFSKRENFFSKIFFPKREKKIFFQNFIFAWNFQKREKIDFHLRGRFRPHSDLLRGSGWSKSTRRRISYL